MRNVTISLDEGLLAAARKRAEQMGKSFNEYARDLLRDDVGDNNANRAEAAFAFADALGKQSDGGFLSREAANERG